MFQHSRRVQKTSYKTRERDIKRVCVCVRACTCIEDLLPFYRRRTCSVLSLNQRRKQQFETVRESKLFVHRILRRFYFTTTKTCICVCVYVYTYIYIYIWYALSFRGHDIRLDILLLLRYENINDAFGKLSGVIKETNKFFFFFLFNPFLQTSLYFEVKEN